MTKAATEEKEREYATTREVCDLCRFSESHLARVRAAGGFPAPVRIGSKKNLYKTIEVRAWLESKRVPQIVGQP